MSNTYKIIIVAVIYFGAIFLLFDSFGIAFLVSILAVYFFIEEGVIFITITPIVFFGTYWFFDEIWLALFFAGVAAVLLSKNIVKNRRNGRGGGGFGGCGGGGGDCGGGGDSSGGDGGGGGCGGCGGG
ncbi:hypothetical protein QUF74_03385 [Candidatus Halobeggiatoa sp. HSG11]|nr:hypothetical protein [Candidatus Halobeggiatoa sp. HSG11]